MTDGNLFTLLFDDVVAELGLITAAVYGVLWRYCQRRDKECYASQQHLAEHLGITRQTLNKHISILVKSKYIEDVTADREGQTHTYRLTNKRNGGVVTTGPPIKKVDTPNGEPVKEIDTTCQRNGQPPVKESHTRNTSEEYIEEKKESARVSSRRSRADPRTNHPAIQCVKGIMETKSNPPKALYDEFIKVLGDSPDGPRLAHCFREWVKRGFKPTNYAWVFEWYADGIPKNGNRAGYSKQPQYGEAVTDLAFWEQYAKEVNGV